MSEIRQTATAFLGLGRMGLPMAVRLMKAGIDVRGYDRDPDRRRRFAEAGGSIASTAAVAAEGRDIVITMVPDGTVVRALLTDEDALAAMAPGGTVIDMSSSRPSDTLATGQDVSAAGRVMIDAPVSGGVSRAEDGSLAIMAGGDRAAIDRVRPVLDAMGRSVHHAGGLGAGHAVKALNNFVSATGLAAMCEAVIAAEAFGIPGEVMIDILNASTGRNNSTQTKARPFILSGSYASGFAMDLMAKDVGVAASLARDLDLDLSGLEGAAALWARAARTLGDAADHTEIHRYLEAAAHRTGGTDRGGGE